MPRFSIIIPVYNTEKYIDRCISSILNQHYQDFEIVLVDDGSKDNSLELCESWAKKDNRIHVFHQDNKGAGTARNTGIKNASGMYVVFVDSDDSVEADYLESLNATVQKYNEPDVVEFRLKYISPTGEQNIQGTSLSEGSYDNDFIKNDFLPVMLDLKKDESLHYSIFNVLRAVKRELIISNGIVFKESIKRWEDWLFAMEVFKYAHRFAVNRSALYNYYGHEGGGLGGRHDPMTYKYVLDARKAANASFGHLYDVHTEYAVECETRLLERCLSEIYHNEKGAARDKSLLAVLGDPDFIEFCGTTRTNTGIMCIKKYVSDPNQHGKALKLLYKYLKKQTRNYVYKAKLKSIYKKLFFKR